MVQVLESVCASLCQLFAYIIPRYAQYTIVWNTVLSNTVYSIVHPPSKHKSLPGKKTEGKTSIPFCGYSACILLIESDPLEGKGNCRLYGATERNLLIQTGTLNTCATVVTMVNCYLWQRNSIIIKF